MRKFVVRGLITLLAMVMVLGTLSGGILGSQKASAAAPFPGSGTAVSPYLVGTADLFNTIRSYRSSKYYFKLISDIDLSGYSAGAGWDPIGNTSGPFYGHIDGNGYKITGLKINNPTGNYMGLFGYLGSGYSITNLTLENAEVTGNQYVGGLAGYMVTGTISNLAVSGKVTGDVDVGGLVGSNYGGTINGSHAAVNVTGTTDIGGLVGDLEMNGSSISNSYATGNVSGASGGEIVGGLVGLAGTGAITIRNSYASGSVSGGSQVGGLAGSLVSVNIINSYASGDVSGNSLVGGLVGNSGTTALISDSYASGSVRGASSIGGLLGHKDYNLTIKNSYASGLVNEGIGGGDVGGLVGEADNRGEPIINSFYDMNSTGQSASAGGSGISTGQMQNRSTFEADATSIWDFATVWAIDSLHNGGYPNLLTTQAYLDYDGNGGIQGPVPSSHSYVPGETVRVQSGTFVLNQALIDAGNRFNGWNTKPDGSGATYKPGEYFTILSNTTLYANWIIPSTSAGLSSSIGTVSSSGGAEESITNIPYGTTLTALKAALTPSAGATFEIYKADGTTEATQLTTGTKVIVTAQDRITKVTYSVTLNANSAKDMTSFSLAAQTGAATINSTAHTVAIQVAYGTDRSNMAATFALSADASAKVGGVDQISGTTINDFTNPVQYVVSAGDGSTQNWTVTVTVAPNGANDITAFSLAAQTGPATINTTAHTVNIKVAYGTSLNGLIATFTLSTGASAKVGSTTQLSGATANNFSSVVTYTVTAANGSTQIWRVTVTNAAASSAKEITAFSLAEQTKAATINLAAYTVMIEVANGTNLNGLVATFALSSGATASVGSTSQVSGTTANDFTNGVIYTVRAENGSTQDWTVTLSVAKSSAATLTSTIGTVSVGGTASEMLTNIPYGTTLAALKAAITPAANATYEVYEADGVTVASVLALGDKIIVTAQDGATKVTYSVTVNAALSNAATLTSKVGTVSVGGTASETLTNIPYGTTLAALKAAITPAANATYEVNEADGVTVASVLASGDKIIVTAQDGITKVTYTVTVNAALNSAATLISTIGTVSVGGTSSETLTNIPYGTTLAALKSAITPAVYATFEVYEADETTLASSLASGQKIIVTAQDGTTKVTYTLTVNALPTDGGGSITPTSPSITKVSSTDGRLTLPTGYEGMVSLDNEVFVSIPANATNREIKIIIDKMTESNKLLTNNKGLIAGIYDIQKNTPDNFIKPVTITFTFDPTGLQSTQTVTVFYYDVDKKSWAEVTGGHINKNQITVSVNHFGKFAVFGAGQSPELPTETKPSLKLSDINGHWAETDILRAVSQGIVSGYPDGTFKPNHIVTRAEFTVMLVHVLKPRESGAELTFTDASAIGAWAKTAVAQAVEAGFIKGYEDGTFRPDEALTRAEMAVMITNALHLSVDSSTATGFADDKKIPSWAKDAVTALRKLGYIRGSGSNQLKPNDKTTRAEAVTILMKLSSQ